MNRVFAAAILGCLASTGAMAQTLPLSGSAECNPPSVAPPQANEVLRLDPGLDAVIAPGVNVETLASGFHATEGPMWREGRLWISDQCDGQIYALTETGAKSVVAKDTGWTIDPKVTVNQGPNGMVPDRRGVLVMRQGFRDISRRTDDGRFSVLLATFEGKRFNSPNDLIYGPDGALYFTDPAFSLPGGTGGPNAELGFEGVYRYGDGKVTALVKTLTRPNGIGLSPDGRTLYVSTSTPGPRVLAYDILPDGSVGPGRDFYVWVLPPGQRGGVDGLKVDSRGNIWATAAGAVNIISPQAKLLGRIQVAGHATSNVAFGGRDMKTVFLTGGPYVYRLQSLVAGQRPLYQRP